MADLPERGGAGFMIHPHGLYDCDLCEATDVPMAQVWSISHWSEGSVGVLLCMPCLEKVRAALNAVGRG